MEHTFLMDKHGRDWSGEVLHETAVAAIKVAAGSFHLWSSL